MTPSYPELKEEESIRHLLAEYQTVRRISAALGCSRKAVWCAMKRYGIRQEKLMVPEELKKKLKIK